MEDRILDRILERTFKVQIDFSFFPRGRDVKFTKLHRRMHTRKARLFNCRESLLKILAENVTPIYIL